MSIRANMRMAAALTAAIAGFAALPAAAATVGLPILTSAPGTLSFVNEFGPELLPTNLFTMSFNGTIASAQGAPELAGATLSFSMFVSDYGGFYIEDAPGNHFTIGGENIMLLGASHDVIPAFFPIASEVDNGDGTWTYTYHAPFNGFGPKTGDYPDVALQFSWTGGYPSKDGYLYGPCAEAYGCAGGDWSNTPLDFDPENPLYLWEHFVYVEGSITDAVITLATVGGPAPEIPPVPLPAAGWLLGAAVFGLGVARRRPTSRRG